MNSRLIVAQFFNQEKEKGKSGNIFYYKNKIYSYGEHYLMAMLIDINNTKTCLLNDAGYSVSTARHTEFVSREAENKGYSIILISDLTSFADRPSISDFKLEIDLIDAKIADYNAKIPRCRKLRKIGYYKDSITELESRKKLFSDNSDVIMNHIKGGKI
jgi:hypothetical protein